MNGAMKSLQERAISPRSVRYTRRFRFGNHSVRLRELEREFGACRLLYLFEAREDAVAMARACNGL